MPREPLIFKGGYDAHTQTLKIDPENRSGSKIHPIQ